MSANQIELGSCKLEYKDSITTEYFYRTNGSLIDSCWSYSGLGSPGVKFGCNSEELLNPPCEGSGCGQMEGRKIPKYYCKTE